MSRIIKCENNHYYDADKFGRCPHCHREEKEIKNRGKDSRVENLDYINTMVKYLFDEKKRFRKNPDVPESVWCQEKESSMELVVGWLVCITGKERGKDYRLQSGFNKIGRGLTMDIILKGDISVSRETHCAVVYDKKSNETFLMPGNGMMTYLKGEIVKEAKQIYSGDVLEIGENKYVFIAFCEGERKWEEK